MYMKSQVTIIINGTRYDAVDVTKEHSSCDTCDMQNLCDMDVFDAFACVKMIGENRHFKKSAKSFEL